MQLCAYSKKYSGRSRAMVIAALLMICALTGCGSTPAHTPLAMMGASCAPSSHHTIATKAPVILKENVEARTDTATESLYFDFAPAFAATCRPDFQLTRIELAMAYAQAKPTPTFDMMPMFGSTASPGARRWPAIISTIDLTDAN